MFRTVVCLMAALGLLLGFNSLAAAAPAKTPEERFAGLDKDGDKKLSLDELVGKKTGEKKEKAEKRFKRLDKDKDMYLTLDEFKAGVKKKKD